MSILPDASSLVNPTLIDTTDYSVPFTPSPEDEAAYLAMLAESDDHDDIITAHFIAERESTLADHHDEWGFVSDDELIECRGHHPYLSYDV